MANYKKKNKGVNITLDLLDKRVAERTSLTQPQVRECWNAVFEIVETFTLHPDCPHKFTLKLGNIGRLTLCPRSGRKVGVYQRPDWYDKTKIHTTVIEEETPSWQVITFKPYPAYSKKLKEMSKFRAKNQEWMDFENGKKYVGWKARAGKYYSHDAEV